MLRLASTMETLVVKIGRLIAWATLAMVLLTVVVVVMRYFFDAGYIWMQELVTWFHAAVFLLGSAYTLSRDEHVRVDILYRRLSAPVRAWIDIVGTVILLWPVCGFLFYAASRYAFKSWQVAERSPETGGLPFPLIPIGKTMMALMLLLLIVQGAVIILRNWHALSSGRFPGSRGAEAEL